MRNTMLSVTVSMMSSDTCPLQEGNCPQWKFKHEDSRTRTGLGILKLAAAGAMPLRSLNWSPKLATIVRPPWSCSTGVRAWHSRTAGLSGTWRALEPPPQDQRALATWIVCVRLCDELCLQQVAFYLSTRWCRV
jgi:hypothetical protein